jgi:hypothetical protein
MPYGAVPFPSDGMLVEKQSLLGEHELLKRPAPVTPQRTIHEAVMLFMTQSVFNMAFRRILDLQNASFPVLNLCGRYTPDTPEAVVCAGTECCHFREIGIGVDGAHVVDLRVLSFEIVLHNA